ncbi:hypothetical protein N7470_007530 [Penicillium chermesinum]|nr:hypothetical protein N7470_007530 [Penicillium chermesinum]
MGSAQNPALGAPPPFGPITGLFCHPRPRLQPSRVRHGAPRRLARPRQVGSFQADFWLDERLVNDRPRFPRYHVGTIPWIRLYHAVDPTSAAAFAIEAHAQII